MTIYDKIFARSWSARRSMSGVCHAPIDFLSGHWLFPEPAFGRLVQRREGRFVAAPGSVRCLRGESPVTTPTGQATLLPPAGEVCPRFGGQCAHHREYRTSSHAVVPLRR